MNIRCAVTAASPSRLLAALARSGISARDFARTDDGCEFSVAKKQYRKTLEICNALCYTIRTVGRSKKSVTAVRIISCAVAVILLFGIPMLGWNTLSRIEIVGGTVYEAEIWAKLGELNVTTGVRKRGLNLTAISDELTRLDGISRVQALVSGTVLVLSVRDSVVPDEPVVTVFGGSIVSACDAKVTDIAVISGTAKVKVGDIVTKGQLLVEGFEGEGADRIAVQPRAVIYGESWATATTDFCDSETIFVRTGERSRHVSYYLRDIAIWSDETVSPYAHFETETVLQEKSFFLPIKMKVTTYYETEPLTITRDFETERAEIERDVLERARKLAIYGSIKDEYVVTDSGSGKIRVRGVVVMSVIISEH